MHIWIQLGLWADSKTQGSQIQAHTVSADQTASKYSLAVRSLQNDKTKSYESLSKIVNKQII